MYVLEGSRLGSRALLRVVSASPDSVVASATAYLGQGAGLPLWPTFLSMLQRGAAHNDHDKLIAAARRAFGLFEMSFSAIDC
jgi:heme oxygenase